MKLKMKLLLLKIMMYVLLLKNLIKFSARLAQANLAGKSDIANFAEKQILMINLKKLKKIVASNKNELN